MLPTYVIVIARPDTSPPLLFTQSSDVLRIQPYVPSLKYHTPPVPTQLLLREHPSTSRMTI